MNQVPGELYIELGVIVVNTIFNNIAVISLQSVLEVEETKVPGENHNVSFDKDEIYVYLFINTTFIENVMNADK